MLRFLVAPARLAVHAIAVLGIAVCVWLGSWQFGRAATHDGPPPPVALATVSTAGQVPALDVLGTVVVADGTFDAVHARELARAGAPAAAGRWQAVPLQLSDGSGVLVVRGAFPVTGAIPVIPAGEVGITGVLSQAEAGTGPGLVDVAAVAAAVPYPLHGGYLVATAEQPAAVGVTAIDVMTAHDASSAPFSNTSYGYQWLLFAAFVIFMWWRVLRDQWQREQERAGEDRVRERAS